MKLTIITVDGAVYKDGISYSGLDLSIVPVNVHALQWDSVAGWIEFKDTIPNENITELPVWANACLTKWDEAKAAEETVIETAKQTEANN
jgi:hypothetical protein